MFRSSRYQTSKLQSTGGHPGPAPAPLYCTYERSLRKRKLLEFHVSRSSSLSSSSQLVSTQSVVSSRREDLTLSGEQTGSSESWISEALERWQAQLEALTLRARRQSIGSGASKAWAKWHYDGTFIYHFIATGLVFIYTLFATAATFSVKTPSTAFVLFLLDLIASYLLISSVSSVVGVAYIAREGNKHFGYPAVCGIFDKYCNTIIASGVITVASFVFLLLAVIIGAYKLLKHWAYSS
ncbi:hypothetical protein R1flu_004169 [Riccia fluitans]|uniref:CASP-like protein n=1 Tax=Riccia fluitans TaxID=41844 RepID=A0ABD1YPI8_9MARC